MSCGPISGFDIATGFAIVTYPFVIGDLMEIRLGGMESPLGRSSAVIEAIIGPCRQLDSTFTVNVADDKPKMLGNKTAPGARMGCAYVGFPNSRLSDMADMLTNGLESAWAIPATPNITTAVNKVITNFIVSSPKKTYFQTTVFLPPMANSKPNCFAAPSDLRRSVLLSRHLLR